MSLFTDAGAGVALLTLMVKASAILALTLAAHLALRQRASAATRHGVWTLAVVCLLLLPPLSLNGPEWTVRVALPHASEEVIPASVEATHLTTGTTSETPAEHATPSSSPSIDARPARGWNWPAVAFGVYAAGVFLLLASLVVDHWRARQIIADAAPVLEREWTALLDECRQVLGIERPVRLLRASGPLMPMVVGLGRPALMLPRDADSWNAERRRSVVLHELAHIERRDCLTQTLASLATAAYWPHPGVWWAARQLQIEREFACDDRVLGAGAVAGDYASDLLEIAYTLGGRRSPSHAVTMARRGQLEGRLLAVLDAARNRATPGLRSRLAAAVTALTVVVPVAAVTVSARAALPVGLEEASSARPVQTASVAPIAAATVASRPPARTVASTGSTPAHRAVSAVLSENSTSGTWSVQTSDKPGEVYLEVRQDRSNSGHSTPLSRLEGLSSAQIASGGPVKFLLRRDAGTFTFEGLFRDGVGGGTFTYAANPAFADELAKRGIGRPTPGEQYEMAKHDVGLALVDELKTQGYAAPSVDDLVQAGHHGVTLAFVQGMGQLGYKVGTVDTLIGMRDHGVTPDYVKGMTSEGLPRLSADDLIRARDHGVTPDYVQSLKRLGYGGLDLDALVNARDHGVTADYVKGMRDSGYASLTLDQLRVARDHGMSSDYVKAMSELGYAKVPLDELRNARDHGVSADFVRDMRAQGYTLPLPELVNARDHGVTGSYAADLKGLGYDKLSIDELVTLRDHGVTADRVKRANAKAGTKLPIDMLRSLADGGMR